MDSVQLGNGNLHIEIPLFTVAGRGLPYQSFFVLDTKQWSVYFMTDRSTGETDAFITSDLNGTLFGSFNTNSAYHVTFSYNPGRTSCLNHIGWYYNGVVREPNGTKHHLVPDVGASNPNCQLPTAYYADDGSGFADFAAGIFSKDGTSIGGTIGFLTDTNGNQLTELSPPTGPYVDTLGRQFPFPGTRQYYDSSGNLQTIQYTTVPVLVNTNLCQFYIHQASVCYEDSGNETEISSITLPNGAKYSLTYVQNDMGEPASITLPSGAQISWTYTFGDKGGPVVTTRTVTANGQANKWIYNYGGTTGCPAGISTCVYGIIDPLGNETDFTWQLFQNNYPGPLNPLPFITTKKFNDKSSGTSVLVKTEQTDYSSSNGPVLPIRVTTTWNQTNQVSKVETDYDSFTGISGTLGYTFSASNPIARREYDWGSGAPGNLLRNTLFNYLHLANSTYLNRNIADRVTSKIVYDGQSNLRAQTTFSHDSTTITSTSGAPNHDYTGHGSTFTTRGNLTQTSRWVNTTGTYLNTTNVYDDLGNLRSTTDPAGNVTSFSYADNFTDGVNRNAQAFVTQTTHPVTNGVNHIEKKQFFWYTSLVAASCGQNFSAACSNSLSPPQPDYAKFTYDNMFRPLMITRGDGGSSTFSYNDTTLPLSGTASTAINSSLSKTTTTLFDDLYRLKQTQLTSDQQGTVFTDTTYDALGRVATVSNPYRTGSDATTTAGTTTYFYDSLDRKCLEVPPDGTLPGTGVLCPTTQPANDLFTTYSGNTTTVTDQTGKSRKSATDGLGRLSQVFEDPASLNYETDYSFDALGNLLTVNQKGGSSNSALWRTRTFTYDSLSRLLTSNNPEVGTITYKYDSDTNCASPNSFPDLLVSKTDARGIRTCSQFDALNRETVRNYSNSDPTITTTYDQSNCLGLPSCQNIGHRTSVTDAAGSEAWAFDVMDRIHKDQRTTSGITKPTTYNVDYVGNTTQATYPTGRIVNYTFGAADRPSTAVDASNGITYATGFKTPPANTACSATAACYTPQGTFYALSIGQTSSYSGLNLTHIYNSRLQPQEFKASSSGGNAIDISYSYLDSANHNSGHVYGITNNLDGTRSQTFSYDSLNRLTSALTTSTWSSSPAHCWGESFTMDAWGNLQSIAATTNAAYTGCSQESGFSRTADGNNHLSGFSYDASGNTTTTR